MSMQASAYRSSSSASEPTEPNIDASGALGGATGTSSLPPSPGIDSRILDLVQMVNALRVRRQASLGRWSAPT